MVEDSLDPRVVPASVFLRYFVTRVPQGKICLLLSAIAIACGVTSFVWPHRFGAIRFLAGGPYLVLMPVVLFLVTFFLSGFANYSASRLIATVVAFVGIAPYVLPYAPPSYVIAYLPHPFFVAVAALAVFGYMAFVSERRKVKVPHPKASRPLRLGFESLSIALALFAVMLFALASIYGINQGNVEIAVILAVGVGAAYFICPFVGYNLFWNGRIFDGAAPLLLVLLLLTFLRMGIQAQFGL